MQIHLISGFLGSGKTTAIRTACKVLQSNNKKAFPSTKGRKSFFPWFHPVSVFNIAPGTDKPRPHVMQAYRPGTRSVATDNGVVPCTFLSRYRLARGTGLLVAKLLSAVSRTLSVHHVGGGMSCLCARFIIYFKFMAIRNYS